MHTLDGQPAYFDGTQVVFIGQRVGRKILLDSLDELRRQQKLSAKEDERNGTVGEVRYGYISFLK